MTPTWAFPLSLLIFIMIPATVLIVGVILFFVKPKYTKQVGAALTVIGGVELFLWLSLTRDIASFMVFIYLLTLLLGVSSLAYASRVPKN